MNFARVALPVVLALTATPAMAGWGPLEWGADIDSVLAAMPEASRVQDERDLRVHEQPRLATSQQIENGIAYEVNYYFSDRRGRELTMVRVQPVDTAQCGDMRTHYAARLGDGIDQSRVLQLEPGRPQIDMTSILWPVDGSAEVIELSDVQIEGAPLRFCHVLFQDHDFVEN